MDIEKVVDFLDSKKIRLVDRSRGKYFKSFLLYEDGKRISVLTCDYLRNFRMSTGDLPEEFLANFYELLDQTNSNEVLKKYL